MNTLKGWITTLVLALTLMTSTAVANTGVIIGGRGDNQPCTPPIKESVDNGVIIGGLTGVIIGGFAATIGVIIGGIIPVEEPVENCGVIIGG